MIINNLKFIIFGKANIYLNIHGAHGQYTDLLTSHDFTLGTWPLPCWVLLQILSLPVLGIEWNDIAILLEEDSPVPCVLYRKCK